MPRRSVTARPDLGLEHVLCTFPDVARGSDGVRLVVPADRMPTASLIVHIVDAPQQPVPGTAATLVSPLRVPFQPTESAADGRLHFDSLPPGSHTLEIFAPGHVAVHMPVVVRSDAPTDLGEIRLERAALLRVRPCQADGASWPSGLPVPWLRGERGERLDPFPRLHRDGDAWVFDSLPAGRYQIVVNGGEGMLAAPLPVELRLDQETRVDWATSIGLSITCAFPSANGTIAADDALRLTVRDAKGRDIPLHDGPRNNGDHWTLFQTFALGDYEVDATSSSGQRWHTTLHVRDLQNDPTSVEVPVVR